MKPTSRFLLATLAAIVLGAIVHLVVILSMPSFAKRDAFSLLGSDSDEYSPGFVSSPANESSQPWLRYADPSVTVAICAYDLARGPYIITAKGDDSFQSMSFYVHQGSVFFAVTDRAQVRGQSSFILATEKQMAQLIQSGEYDEFYSRNIKVTAPSTKGLVVLRTLAPYPSFRNISESTVALASCERLTAEGYPQLPDEEDGRGIPQDLLPPRRGGQ